MPIFNNLFILKGLSIAIGIPFGALITFIMIVSKGDILGTDAKYVFLLLAILFVLTYLIVLFVYGGRYAPGFIVDEEGITNYTQVKQEKQNKIITTILIIFGLYSGNLTIAGTGFISKNRQVLRIKWGSINRINFYPKHRTIIVKGSFTEKMAVFCTKENYTEVEGLIRDKISSFNREVIEK